MLRLRLMTRIGQALLRRRRTRSDEFFLRLARRAAPTPGARRGPDFMDDEIIDAEPEFDAAELHAYRTGQRPDAVERRRAAPAS